MSKVAQIEDALRRPGADKDEEMWKTVYFPRVVRDDNNVGFMFRHMVENNILYLCVHFNCTCEECQ
ncbi:hypothetical protein MTR_3g078627 [Medicago truncatula]|uniref:Uncharacterized protein n=1 Tax=Medicago truncatula TaxID=3880 RepID=A0A072VA78_MEDTR|nr:hypothetical protein MTR_3g078627 [Medicago truncatula]